MLLVVVVAVVVTIYYLAVIGLIRRASSLSFSCCYCTIYFIDSRFRVMRDFIAATFTVTARVTATVTATVTADRPKRRACQGHILRFGGFIFSFLIRNLLAHFAPFVASRSRNK